MTFTYLTSIYGMCVITAVTTPQQKVAVMRLQPTAVNRKKEKPDHAKHFRMVTGFMFCML